jgi:uncharacterized protein YjdB
MVKFKNFLWGTLAMLTALLMVGCDEKDNPVSTSLRMDTSTLVLSVGQSARRTARSAAEDAKFTYTSSVPSVATVDQRGKVTALTVGNAEIKVEMGAAGGFAASTLQYTVQVNPVSAPALKNVDKTTPLTLVAAEDGKITVYFNGGITLENDIKYTVNGGEEQTIAKNTEGSYDIIVKKGDTVQLYSENTSLGGGSVAGARGLTRAVEEGAKFINIRPSMKTEIFGNVMSLLKGKDNLDSEDAETIEADNAFYGLFSGADKLVNSEERELVLPATTLKDGCYQDMFSGCKGIEKAPELPAPTLVKDCYSGMFADCSKLSEVKCLATDVSADGCVKDWLADAGKEAETPPVVEIVEDSNWSTAAADAIPANFTKVIAISAITVEPEILLMKIGDTATLRATVEPAEAIDNPIKWFSDDPFVATVTDKGEVTAVGAGSTKITVSTPDGGVFAVCKVTVEALPEPDDNTPYKVWVYGEDPRQEPSFSPSALDGAAMRFSSTEGKYFRTLTDDEYFGLKTLIVDVSDATDDCTMKVMNGWWSATYADYVPVLNGQMKIQITEEMAKDCAKGGGGRDLDLMLYGGSCTINSVYYIEGESQGDDGEKVLITDVSLPESHSMVSGTNSNTLAAQIRITPENATDKSMTWTSDNTSVVKVNEYGVVFAQKNVSGVAHVTATANDGSGKSATCTVSVKGLGSIKYETTEVTKTPGSTFTNNSLVLVGDGTVTYTSSDTNIAKVNASTGEVTIAADVSGIQTVTITATASDSDKYIYPADEKSASYTVKVSPATTQAEMDDFNPGSW